MNAKETKRSSRETRLIKLALVLLSVAIGTVCVDRLSYASRDDEQNPGKGKTTASERQIDANAQRMLDEGKQAFRFDTFGDEAFWTDALQLQRALAGAKLRPETRASRHEYCR